MTGGKGLVGVNPDGQVRSSTDPGATWQPGGRLPMRPVAFTAVSAEHLLAAAMNGMVYESVDSGATFRTIYQP
ncbi:hypothetical protein [Nonomuraea sp. NPDC049028]|uniref:hypothetical protein n=1 Tax=Nonomuraea sp. NPDC049028 TaxID=3364348 RepID=UPI003712DBD9